MARGHLEVTGKLQLAWPWWTRAPSEMEMEDGLDTGVWSTTSCGVPLKGRTPGSMKLESFPPMPPTPARARLPQGDRLGQDQAAATLNIHTRPAKRKPMIGP